MKTFGADRADEERVRQATIKLKITAIYKAHRSLVEEMM